MSGNRKACTRLDATRRSPHLVMAFAAALALPSGAQAVPVGTQASLSLGGSTTSFPSGVGGQISAFFSATPADAHTGDLVSHVADDDGAAIGLGSVNASGEASASIGRLRARVTGAAVTRATAASDAPFVISTASLTTRVAASWSDTLSISNVPPGFVTVNGLFHVTGTLAHGLTAPTFANDGAVGVSISVTSNHLLVTGAHGEDESPAFVVAKDLPEFIPVAISLHTSFPLEVFFALTLDGSASLSSSLPVEATAEYRSIAEAGFIGDFSHTLEWGGITSVTDAAGNPLVGWRVNSLSGFDYAQPAAVPLPPTLALSIGGVLMTAFAGSRRPRAA